MPKLPTYDAGTNIGLQPTETGVESVAGAARRVGGFYHQRAAAEDQLARETERLGAQTEQLGSEKANLLTGEGGRLGSAVAAAGDAAVKVADHQQISHGAAAFTGLMAQATADWNNTVKNADPNAVPTLAKDFMAGNLEPKLADFKNAFWTEGAQQWAEAHVDALRQHLTEKTSADISSAAGQASIVNHQQVINSLSSTVHDDPSSLDFALATLKSSTEGIISSSPNLTLPQAAHIRGELTQNGAESIVKSAIIGYINKTGRVPDWASDPKYAPYTKGQELQLFAKQAQVVQKQQDLIQKQTVETQKRIDDMNAHAAANKAFTDNVSIDPATGRPIINPNLYRDALDIPRKNPNAASASTIARTLWDWGESQQRERAGQVVDDQATKADLLTRFADPQRPLTNIDVLSAEAKGQLSTRTGTIYREMIEQRDKMPADPVLHSVIDAAKERVGESLVGDGHERFANFMATFWPQYTKAKLDGTLPADALDLKDPNSMISKAIKTFEPSTNERMMGHLEKAQGLAPGAITAGAAVIALPALSDRKSDQVYPTPRGPMKWTGTGWIDPNAPAPPATVSTPADAAKLAPGTHYRTPDGREFIR